MVHVVDGHAVQQDEVLVRTAAAHIEAGRTLAAALHARHHLQDFQHIGFAEEDRRVPDLDQGNVHGAQIGALDAGVLLRHDPGLRQRLTSLQRDIDDRIAPQVHMQHEVLIANV